jgi:dCMP deaminase
MTSRPNWDDIWMSFAMTIAKRSYDPRFHVGAVIVTEDNCQVLSVGYNGNYSGGPNCAESSEKGMSGLVHAEINALIKLDYNNPKKKKMYLTLSPCWMCAKAIINSGINTVIFSEKYRDDRGVALLESMGLNVIQHKSKAI